MTTRKSFIIPIERDRVDVNLFEVEEFIRCMSDREERAKFIELYKDGKIPANVLAGKAGLPEGIIDLVLMLEDPGIKKANEYSIETLKEWRKSNPDAPLENAYSAKITAEHDRLLEKYPGAKKFLKKYHELIAETNIRRGYDDKARIVPAQAVFAFAAANVVVYANAFAAANAVFFVNLNAGANANAAANANAVTNANTFTDDSSTLNAVCSGE